MRKRLNKEKIKKQPIDSIVNKEILETEELNKNAEKVQKPEGAAAIIKQYEDIIRAKSFLENEKYYIHSVSSRKRNNSSNWSASLRYARVL